MKATFNQIEKALTNNYKVGVDGTEFLREMIRDNFEIARTNVSRQTPYHTEFFRKSHWKIVYREIKKLITKYED
jgi:hypothetical protein